MKLNSAFLFVMLICPLDGVASYSGKFSFLSTNPTCCESAIIEPTFKKGTFDHFNKWFDRNLRYPRGIDNNLYGGNTVVRFTIGTDGKIKNVVLVSTPHNAFWLETQRLLKASPKWEPATRDGIPVEYTYTYTIDFRYHWKDPQTPFDKNSIDEAKLW